MNNMFRDNEVHMRRIGLCALKDMGRALSTGGAQHVRGELNVHRAAWGRWMEVQGYQQCMMEEEHMEHGACTALGVGWLCAKVGRKHIKTAHGAEHGTARVIRN